MYENSSRKGGAGMSDLMSSKEETLKNFMEEMFDINSMIEVGFFKQGESYEDHAKRVCQFFGFKTVYEYGAIEARGHITFGGPDPAGLSLGDRKGEPFVTEFSNIYKD